MKWPIRKSQTLIMDVGFIIIYICFSSMRWFLPNIPSPSGPWLTQSDLSLHWHGQSWMADLTAEQRLVVQLRVETPGQHGSHLDGPVTRRLLLQLEVVERVAVLDPAWKLPAHHRLRDRLSGGLWAGLWTLLLSPFYNTRFILTQVRLLHFF